MKTEDIDITVASTTQTDEQIRKDLGLPADEPPPVDPAAIVAEPPAPDAVAEAEADSPKPDAEVSEAARKLRGSRADVRKSKIQDEINDLTRKKNDELRELERLRTARAALEKATPPPAGEKPKADAVPPPAAKAAPEFSFPSFEEYQETHPEADLREYTVALTDARMDFKASELARRTAATAAHQAAHTAVTTFRTAEQEFSATHPDYHDVCNRIALPPDLPNGERDPLVKDFEAAVLRAGKDGPLTLHYLGTHPEDAARLIAAESPAEFHTLFGELRFAARVAQSAAPAAAPAAPAADPAPAAAASVPRTPKSNAPAPVSQLPAGTIATRTLQQLAEDSEDADEYIAARQPKRRTG